MSNDTFDHSSATGVYLETMNASSALENMLFLLDEEHVEERKALEYAIRVLNEKLDIIVATLPF